MAEKILVCTVGGSADPLITAIRQTRPSRVVFVCSDGENSSRSKVEGEDGIAVAAGLGPGKWKIVEIPVDDPDAGFARIRNELVKLRKKLPTATVVADYTGGSKSMSVALAMAALATQAAIQLTTGCRPDLVKVEKGTERPVKVGFETVFAEFTLVRAAEAWNRFAYGDASVWLDRLYRDLTLSEEVSTPSQHLKRRVGQLANASMMFESWDRFDHHEAKYLFREHQLDQLPGLKAYGRALQLLTSENREPLILLDLWHNAQRRAARGRFDDALARLYRLVEWSAQYVLRTERGIETARFDPSILPQGKLRKQLEARFQEGNRTVRIGLVDSLLALRSLLPEHPLAASLTTRFAGEIPLQRLQQWIERRNRSILAHGFVPVDRELWAEAEGWMKAHWLSWLQGELRGKGQDLPQFPTSFPA